MKRKQVFVRAKSPSGKWHSADVLDLDDLSFRAFVMGVLHEAGLVVGIKDDFVAGNRIELHTTTEPSS